MSAVIFSCVLRDSIAHYVFYHLVCFWFFSLFTAPAHPHATWAAVYMALLFYTPFLIFNHISSVLFFGIAGIWKMLTIAWNVEIDIKQSMK